MLARTLALRPSLLLLDEPTSALGEAAKAAIEATLRELRDRLGLSFVLVTHHLDQAARLADRVLVLEPGALREPAGIRTGALGLDVADPLMLGITLVILRSLAVLAHRALP